MSDEIYKYNGRNLDSTDGVSGYVVTEFDWLSGLNQSDRIKSLGGVQGVYSSATYVRGRTLVLEGGIQANSSAELLVLIKDLKKLLKIDWIPTGEGTKPLEITDEGGTVWTAQARVKDLPLFRISGFTAEYRAVFFLSDATYKSKVIHSTSGSEGIMGGVRLGRSLPFAMNEKTTSISIITTTPTDTPLKVTITATGTINTFLRIQNTTNGQFYKTNTPCVAGDVIIIDAETKTATKNGVSILGDKEAGSTWLFIDDNANFTISDGDLAGDFTAEIEFTDRLL